MSLTQPDIAKEVKRRKKEWKLLGKLWPTVLQETCEQAKRDGMANNKIQQWCDDPNPLDMTFQGYKLRLHLDGRVELRLPSDLPDIPPDSPYMDDYVKLVQRYHADVPYSGLPKLINVAETFPAIVKQRILDDLANW